MSRWLFSSLMTALVATAVAAQGPPVSIQPPTPANAAQNITLNGCVSPGQTAADPFTLSNAARLAPTTVPEASTVSPPATSPTGAPSVTTGTTGAVGTAGTMAAAGTAGAAGTTGTMTVGGTPSTAGAAGTATPAMPGLPPTMYQLSGTSVGSYVGQ